MKVFNWINLRLILMFALVIFLFAFTSNRNAHRKLIKTEVIFVDNDADFISKKTVNKLLIENKTDVRSIAKEDLNLNKLENSINKNPMVEKAEVYVTVDGVLKAIVKQKTPVARVFDSVGTYYLDNEGNTMPLSGLNTARVPLVVGEISPRNRKKLAQVLRVIYKDPFLKKNIIGVELDANDDVKMTNRNFDFQIEFGKMVQIEKKFNNYKAFFQKTIVDSSLTKYKKINLRFSHQVVCTK
jgi:cell division protein FtsQ